jgi:phage portal protein BeeE
MGLINLFRRKPIEKRADGTGYTAQIMAARASYIAGVSGIGELTATVQACVSLWEGAFALADVQGTDVLPRRTMAIMARALALRGEFVALISDRGILPASDWEASTADGVPRAYRLSIPEAGGGRGFTALAPEVVHVRIGSDPVAPWTGTAPLRRASLTGQMLHEIESALRDTFRDAPLGSLIVPLPASSADDMAQMRSAFRGRRGSTLVVEGVAQATAAGMNPQLGQRLEQLSPDLEKTMAIEGWQAARGAICAAFGVLPGWLVDNAQGPLVREAQRQLAAWTLQPIAELLAEEATAKLGTAVSVDLIRPLQAFDAGGRARALAQIIEAMGRAKELGLSADQMNAALLAVNLGGGDANA